MIRFWNNRSILTLASWLLTVGLCYGEEQQAANYSAPLTAAKSLEALAVVDGFEMELVAAEPLIVDPVAFAFAADGSLWVVEMGDYPFGGRGGRVKRLLDKDADGRFDDAVVFLDGLKHPTSVLPWRDGVLVAAAPRIVFARDTTGDGVADEQRTVLDGFAESNAQHQVNSLRWGLDNHIHAANGDSGGLIGPPGAERVDIHGHDLRFDPGRPVVSLESGMSQHTRFRDDWGNWFGGNSAWPFWHDVLPVRYLNRNPQQDAPMSCRYLTDPAANPEVFPRSRAQPRLNEFRQQRLITSACGGCSYRDDLFGPDYLHSVFVCDPANNLVHHRRLGRNRASYVARRPANQVDREFLASTDPWFRPVYAGTGPDGALYIADMYRLIIEHPDYFQRDPTTLKPLGRGGAKESPALATLMKRGASRGRIYRIRPSDAKRRPQTVALNTSDAVLSELRSRNGVRRDLAHQNLVTSKRRVTKEELKPLLADNEPRVRLQALAVLDGRKQVSVDELSQALRDPHPLVRRFALRLCEPVLDVANIFEQVARLTSDPDERVRLQAVLSIGGSQKTEAGAVLASAALKHIEDEMVIAAVLSAEPRHTAAVLTHAIKSGRGKDEHRTFVSRLLQIALRNDDTQVLAEGLSSLADSGQADSWTLGVLGELLKSLDHASLQWQDLAGDDVALQQAQRRLASIFVASRKQARDSSQPESLRTASIRLLGRGEERPSDAMLLVRLLQPNEPLSVQRAALDSLSAMGDAEIAPQLLADLDSRGPAIRRQIIKAMLENRDWTVALLKSMERGGTSISQLSLTQRERLTLHYHRDIRAQAKKILTQASTIPRDDGSFVGKSMKLTGDASRGELAFAKHCSVCHRDPPASSAGPPLSALAQLTTERVADSVAHPSRVIEPTYSAYTVILNSGRVLSGVIRRESGSSFDLVDAEGERKSILRADVAELVKLDKSFMPERLREVLTPQDLADISAALKSPESLERIRQSAKSPRHD